MIYSLSKRERQLISPFRYLTPAQQEAALKRSKRKDPAVMGSAGGMGSGKRERREGRPGGAPNNGRKKEKHRDSYYREESLSNRESSPVRSGAGTLLAAKWRQAGADGGKRVPLLCRAAMGALFFWNPRFAAPYRCRTARGSQLRGHSFHHHIGPKPVKGASRPQPRTGLDGIV